MAPHSVALAAVGIYGFNGGSATYFEVEVSGRSTQYYYIRKSGNRYNASQSGNEEKFSCTAYIDHSGNKITIHPHDHKVKTNVKQEFYLQGNVIKDGSISSNEESRYNGSFRGEVKDKGRVVEIYSSPAGRTYTATIKSPNIS